MKYCAVAAILALCWLSACSRQMAPVASSNAVASSMPTSPDAVQRKLREYSGIGATDCGQLNLQASPDQSKTAADCAMQANQRKLPFYVTYDMPGLTIGVAGDSGGKLFSVRREGAAGLTSGDCPSQLRVAASGRVTCFSPEDMGAMGAGHTAIPPDMPNPHAFPKTK
jgi:hypothetical protein